MIPFCKDIVRILVSFCTDDDLDQWLGEKVDQEELFQTQIAHFRLVKTPHTISFFFERQNYRQLAQISNERMQQCQLSTDIVQRLLLSTHKKHMFYQYVRTNYKGQAAAISHCAANLTPNIIVLLCKNWPSIQYFVLACCARSRDCATMVDLCQQLNTAPDELLKDALFAKGVDPQFLIWLLTPFICDPSKRPTMRTALTPYLLDIDDDFDPVVLGLMKNCDLINEQIREKLFARAINKNIHSWRSILFTS